MLFQIGPITLDTFPFNADAMERSGSAALAEKPVMGRRPPLEFMGPGEDKVSLSGRLLPTRIGGLTELAMARSLKDAGTAVPLLRGDGLALGWFAISKIDESHSSLDRNGVGFTVSYTIEMIRSGDEPSRSGGAGVVAMLLSLFEGL